MNDKAYGTYSNPNSIIGSLTPEKLKQVLEEISIRFKEQALPEYKVSWFEKLMNRFGWYRKREYYIIDRQKLSIAYRRKELQL